MPLWDRGRLCLCGGKYLPILGGDYSECERVNCPRAQLGDGSWHKALPKLQELDRKGLMRGRFPDIDLNDVVEEVFGQGARDENFAKWRYHRYQPACRKEVNDHQRAANDEREHESGLRWDTAEQERRWNAPSTEPPASPASSSTRRTPPPLANPATTPLCGQQPDFGPAMTTLANNNPQEANPEGAEHQTSAHSLQAPRPLPVVTAREASDGEMGITGLCSAGTGFPSPTAHSMPANDWEYSSPMAHALRLGI